MRSVKDLHQSHTLPSTLKEHLFPAGVTKVFLNNPHISTFTFLYSCSTFYSETEKNRGINQVLNMCPGITKYYGTVHFSAGSLHLRIQHHVLNQCSHYLSQTGFIVACGRLRSRLSPCSVYQDPLGSHCLPDDDNYPLQVV